LYAKYLAVQLPHITEQKCTQNIPITELDKKTYFKIESLSTIMIYVIWKMDLRKRENEMFVEVFSISIKKTSSF
jgi:hypothetical protein